MVPWGPAMALGQWPTKTDACATSPPPGVVLGSPVDDVGSDGEGANRGEAPGEKHDGESSEEAGEARGAEGCEVVPDVVPGAGPGRGERPDEQDGDLAGDKGHEADKAPAPVDEPEPHAVDEEQREDNE